jgi:hypothetical protein
MAKKRLSYEERLKKVWTNVKMPSLDELMESGDRLFWAGVCGPGRSGPRSDPVVDEGIRQ